MSARYTHLSCHRVWEDAIYPGCLWSKENTHTHTHNTEPLLNECQTCAYIFMMKSRQDYYLSQCTLTICLMFKWSDLLYCYTYFFISTCICSWTAVVCVWCTLLHIKWWVILTPTKPFHKLLPLCTSVWSSGVLHRMVDPSRFQGVIYLMLSSDLIFYQEMPSSWRLWMENDSIKISLSTSGF